MNKFVYGSFAYEYELIREKRKTLGLTVMPDMSIFLKCPPKADAERIELFLKKKWFWLQKQLNFFKKFQKKIYKKEYVSGESFLYLGRQYQLIVKKAKEDKVVLQNGKLVFFTTQSVSDGVHTRIYLNAWYNRRAREIFKDRYEEVFKKFDYDKKLRLEIRKMPKRWGSCARGKNIALNPLLIHASKDCIDYVITHELCHVKYKNHDKRFYKLMNSKYPRWEKVKDKLEMRLS
ncbi:MAG: SprT family zinc-dependent metalloprotease [Candidatus Moraniibacteriota bacterium]